MSKDLLSERVKGSVTGYVKEAYTYTEMGEGTLSCSFIGPKSIQFKGNFSADIEGKNQKTMHYLFRVDNGEVNTETKTGNFTLTAH